MKTMRATWAWVALACMGATSCKTKDPAPAADAMVAVSAASGAASVAASSAPDAALRARPVWVSKLGSEEDFLAYSRETSGERFTKFVVDLKTKAIYYVDADLYPMHKDFIFAELLKTPRTKEAEHEFDKNYGKDKPSFLMCYLVHHLQPDVWSMAFWDGDKATAAHVRLAWSRMKETFYLADKVKFRPNSNDQETVAAEVTEIPKITNDAIYKAAGYQPFHTGTAVGKLKIVKGTADPVFAPDEIVILPEPLTDITPVAGIVSQSFSTPLSHVNLRAAAWDIPNVGLKDAAKTYGALDGKVVRFEAGATGATIRLATPEEIAEAKKAHADKTKVQVPKANLEAKALATLDNMRAAEASAYGQKAANLGEIVHAKLPGVSVPPGFGIPISFYAAHLKAAGIDKKVEALLVDPKFKASITERKTALEKIRQEIEAAPLDPAFVTALTESWKKLTGEADAGAPEDVGVFVRSSTNAEDLPGFSGAGLYDTVPNVRGGADNVAKAVKKVWASVWNLAAYEERELYRIDHKQVYGAVLVQIGVAATAAGVLVTAHPTDPNDTKTFTINAKSGLGMRVVDGKKLPEIILYNTYNRGLRIVSRSDEDTMLVFQPDGGVKEMPNPKKGDPILTNARVMKLADAAAKVRNVFPKDRPLDIEWVLKGEDVYIVQSRPFMGGPKAQGTSPTK